MAAKPKPKAKPKGPPDAARINARAAQDPAFRKRALKNPGLRSKLDPKYLAAPQRAARVLNTRLNSPITPGSQITGRDLAHEAAAATTVRYGPQERELGQQLGVSQAVERDTGTFYDQYRAALQEHAAKVQAFQAGAQQALAQTAQGITGLAGQEGAALQQQANQSASPVAPAGDLSQLASTAAAVRQSLVGSFQGQQALQGAAANTYAGAQANVVAPGQKLAAQAQARGRTQDVRKQLLGLKAEEGAFNQQFRGERRADEFKNVLAEKTLGVTAARTQAQIEADQARTQANTPAAKTEAAGAEAEAREEAKNAAKLGLTRHQYRMLGPTVRKQRLDALKTKTKTGTEHTIREGAFAGLKPSQVDQMSPDAVQRRIDAYNKRGGPGGKTVEPGTQARRDFRQKYGVDLQATSQHNTLKNQVARAQRVFDLVGTKAKDKNTNQMVTVTTDYVANAMQTGGKKGIPQLPAVVIRAALEMKRSGTISAGTANRLHRAGYSVAQLGFKTGSGARKPRRPRQPRGPINTGAFKPIRFPRAR